MMNINEVQKRIKQRPPFQMIEKVLEVEDGEYAKGIKCVSVNEPYFAGHFPDAPIMPGVLVIEACSFARLRWRVRARRTIRSMCC